MPSISTEIVRLAQLMFERRLTDMAGGNISARDEALIYITPRYSGSKRQWRLAEEDLVCGDYRTDDVLSQPDFSREGKAHLAIYRHYPDVGAVIHAHAYNILPFCAAARPIEPLLEQTQKFGVIQVIPQAPAHSSALADYVVAGLQGQEARIRDQAAALLLPKHGIIVAGKDLYSAVDALERIDWNCRSILAQSLLPHTDAARDSNQ